MEKYIFTVRRERRARDGFTLIELMVVVTIMGALASIAIPNFKRYKYQAQWAEAYIMLNHMEQGVKAYYQEEHWQEGVVSTVGRVGASTHCRPTYGAVSGGGFNNHRVIDWSNEEPSWEQIGFTPANPIRFTYSMGVPVVSGAHNYLTAAGGECGLTDQAKIVPHGGYALFRIRAAGAVDGFTQIFQMRDFCVAKAGSAVDDGVIQRCQIWQELNYTCSVSGAGSAEGRPSACILMFSLLGMVLTARRQRRRHHFA